MATTAPMDLNVHDISLKTVSIMQANGTVGFFKQLTFWVGTHGPFSNTWPVATFDANTAKKYIQDQVQELRLLTSP